MKLSKRNILKRAIVLMAPFLFIACEKDNGEIGFDQVIGGLAGLNDSSLSVVSYTQNVDSVLVALDYSSQLQLGGYGGSRLAGARVDPYFGRAEAGIVGQMILSQVNPDFGTNPVVDSVELTLAYSGYYGDTTQPMSFEVLEITSTLVRDTFYYSDFVPQTGTKIGGKENFLPRPGTDVFREDTLNIGPALTIDMDADYFQQKFADVGNGAFPSLADNEDLVEYFKGIHIKAASEDGAILYFNLTSANSRLEIYYHNDVDTAEKIVLSFDQRRATVPINFSIFAQDYNSYPTAFNLNMIDSINGESTTYIQSMGGVATVFKVPDLSAFESDESIVINRAFLEVPVQRGVASGLASSGALEIREMTSNGPGNLIRDFRFAPSAADGRLRLGELRDNKYVFEMTQHVFDVINNGKSPNLAIVPVNKGTTANQTFLKGGNDLVEPVKLTVYYTKL